MNECIVFADINNNIFECLITHIVLYYSLILATLSLGSGDKCIMQLLAAFVQVFFKVGSTGYDN